MDLKLSSIALLIIALKYGLIWIGVPDLIWVTPRKYLVAVLRLKVDLDLFHVPEKQQPPLCYIYRRKQSLLVLVHGCYSYQLVQVPFKKNSFKDANISKIRVKHTYQPKHRFRSTYLNWSLPFIFSCFKLNRTGPKSSSFVK